MKTDFDGFTNGLDTAQKKSLNFRLCQWETFKTKSKRERCLKMNRISKNCASAVMDFLSLSYLGIPKNGGKIQGVIFM